MRTRKLVILLSLISVAGLASAVQPARAFGGCVQATGYVRDAGGRAIAGARVSAHVDSEYCGRTAAWTDRSGRYSVQIGNSGLSPSAPAVASAVGYTTQTRTVYARPLVADRVGPVAGTNDFTLVR